MYSVLFVCTANICRSPMAMAIWQDKIRDEADQWRVESAGTWAPEGEPAATRTRQVLVDQGISMGTHHSRQVTKQILDRYNLILTMEQGHKEALRAEFPQYADRVYMLSEMVGERYDIRDPIGGSLVDFRATAKELNRILTQGYEKIKQLAGG